MIEDAKIGLNIKIRDFEQICVLRSSLDMISIVAVLYFPLQEILHKTSMNIFK